MPSMLGQAGVGLIKAAAAAPATMQAASATMLVAIDAEIVISISVVFNAHNREADESPQLEA